jgi:O-antigen ligase
MTKWINGVSSKFLMPVMAILFIGTNTVFNKWIGERAESLQNLIAAVVLIALLLNIFSNPKKNLPSWIKCNWLVLIYFAARLVSLYLCRFNYTAIRSVFFEAFYLLGICSVLLDKKHTSKFYVKFLFYFELILTAATIALYCAMPLMTSSMKSTLMDITYFEKSGIAMLFSNPNTAGIMAGFGLIICIICYGRGYFSKPFLLISGIYNFIALIIFNSRSSEIGIIAVFICLMLVKVFPKINKKALTTGILAIMVLMLVPLYWFVNESTKVEDFGYSESEIAIDALSTGRYIIWKECIMTQEGDMLFGKGSLHLEQESREEFVSNLEQDYYWRYITASHLGTHNGYLSMISTTGLVGFGLFIAILIQRIVKAKNLKNGNLYLILIYIFVINFFESLFIVNRFFICFYLFLILQSNISEKDDDFLLGEDTL